MRPRLPLYTLHKQHGHGHLSIDQLLILCLKILAIEVFPFSGSARSFHYFGIKDDRLSVPK